MPHMMFSLKAMKIMATPPMNARITAPMMSTIERIRAASRLNDEIAMVAMSKKNPTRKTHPGEIGNVGSFFFFGRGTYDPGRFGKTSSSSGSSNPTEALGGSAGTSSSSPNGSTTAGLGGGL